MLIIFTWANTTVLKEIIGRSNEEEAERFKTVAANLLDAYGCESRQEVESKSTYLQTTKKKKHKFC